MRANASPGRASGCRPWKRAWNHRHFCASTAACTLRLGSERGSSRRTWRHASDGASKTVGGSPPLPTSCLLAAPSDSNTAGGLACVQPTSRFLSASSVLPVAASLPVNSTGTIIVSRPVPPPSGARRRHHSRLRPEPDHRRCRLLLPSGRPWCRHSQTTRPQVCPSARRSSP